MLKALNGLVARIGQVIANNRAPYPVRCLPKLAPLLVLASLLYASGAQAQSVGSIRFSQADYRATEDAGSVTVVVERVGGSDGFANATVLDLGGTATEGVDYGVTSQSSGGVFWSDGEMGPRTLVIDIAGDANDNEGTEFFVLELFDNFGAPLNAPSSTRVSILDSGPVNPPGVISMAVESLDVDEDVGTVRVQVNRTNGSGGRATATFQVTDEETTFGTDYTGPQSGTLVWDDGDDSPRFITFTVLDDFIEERRRFGFRDERFDVTLTDTSGAGLTGNGRLRETTVAIFDDDDNGFLSFEQGVYEIREDIGTFVARVQRANGSSGDASVVIGLRNGNAEEGVDFQLANGSDSISFTWRNGDSSFREIPIVINADGIDEPLEAFRIEVDSITGMSGQTSFASVRIEDVPPVVQMPGVLSLTQSTVSGREGQSLSFTVDRTNGSDGVATLNYRLVDGSAQLGTDYTHTNGTTPTTPTGTLTWADGDDTPQDVTIDLTTDGDLEGDEMFRLEFVDSTGAVFGQLTRGEATINDNNVAGIISFRQADYIVSESDLTIRIVAQQQSPPGRPPGSVLSAVTANIQLGGGTATLNQDYSLPTGGNTVQLFWPTNTFGSQAFDVTIALDALPEVRETFVAEIVQLSGGATLGNQNTTRVTITDAVSGTVQFSPVSYDVFEDAGSVALNLTRTGGSTGPISVNYTVGIDASDDPDSAIFGSDYTHAAGRNGTLTWPDGDTSNRQIQLDIVSDGTFEDPEFLRVFLIPTSQVGQDRVARVTITDRGTRPVPGVAVFEPDFYTVSEDGGSIDLTVIRDGGSDGDLQVTYAAQSGTATLGTDFLAPQGTTLTWADGDVSDRTITVPINPDSDSENTELFTVVLTAADGSTEVAEVEILNVDPQPQSVSLVQSSFVVDEDAGTLEVTVQRTGNGVGEVFVGYVLVGTSATFGDDFDQRTSSVEWPDGDLDDRTITIDIIADNIIEGDESFFIELTSPGGSGGGIVNLGPIPVADVLILDATPTPTPGEINFDPDAYTVAESDGQVILTVTRTNGTSGAASVDYASADVTATAGADYGVTSPVNGTLNWADGDDTPRQITIDIATDNVVDNGENFLVEFSNPIGASVGQQGEAAVTIMDSTASTPDTIVLADAAITVDELVGSVSVVIQRVGSGNGAVSFGYAVNGVTATDGMDYDSGFFSGSGIPTVDWADGDLTDRTLTFPIIDDGIPEQSETFSIRLLQVVSGLAVAGTPAETIVTITDVTPTPGVISFEQDNYTVAESDGLFDVVATRTGGSDGIVTVEYTISDITASGSDYRATDTVNGVLEWADGDMAPQNLVFRALTDNLIEDPETFTIEFDSITGAVFGQLPMTTVTITDSTVPTPGVLSFDPASYTVSESDGQVSLIVTRTGGSAGSASAIYEVLAGTATENQDYTVIGGGLGTLNWPDGDDTPREIVIEIAADADIEPTPETLSASLLDTTGAGFGQTPQADVSITDSTVVQPDTIVFASRTAQVSEDGGTLDVVVQRIGNGNGAVSFEFEVTDITATDGVDYDSTSALNGSQAVVDWADGDLSDQTLTFTILPDNVVDGNETFMVSLLQPVIGQAVAGTPDDIVVTIIDTTPVPTPGVITFEPDTYTVAENDGQVTLTVIREGGADGEVSVDFTALNGQAESGLDFGVTGPLTGTLTWADGDDTPRDITIDIASDALVEVMEDFTVELDNAVGAPLGQSPLAEVNITDSTQPTPDTIVFANGTVSVSEDAGTVSIVVQRVGSGVGAVSFEYFVMDGSAVDGADYDTGAPASGSFTTVDWADGDLSDQIITIDILPDTLVEGDEDFTVILAQAVSGLANAGSPSEVTVTILDTTPVPMPGSINFDPDSYTVSEADGTVTLTVTRTGGSDGAASVDLSTMDGTAMAGQDYALAGAVGATLMWADGDASPRTVSIDIAADGVVEADEDFLVNLTNPTGASMGVFLQAQVTIIDSTPPTPDTIVLASRTLSVDENAGTVSVIVQRVGTGNGAVSFEYAVSDISAIDGVDYDSTSALNGSQATVDWADGDLSDQTLTFDIIDDALVEGNEAFMVSLLQPLVGLAVAGNVTDTVITIVDTTPIPDPGVISFDPDMYTVAEIDGTVTLFVTRTGGQDGDVGVDFTITDGTADAGADYGLSSDLTGRLEWTDGDATPREITVDIEPDGDVETVETFLVDLSNISGASIGQSPQAQVSITDSTVPTPDTIVFADSTLSVNENAGTASVIVQRIGSGDGAVSFEFAVVDGTATDGIDFDSSTALNGSQATVDWADGDLSDQTLTFTLIDDALLEGDETFAVQLLQPLVGLAVAGTPAETIVTIVDTTPIPMPGVIAFDPDSYTVAESDGTVTLNVTRTGGSDGAVSVDFATVDGTAEAGLDYAVTATTTGTLSWPDGDATPRTIEFDIASDNLVEQPENFLVNLTNPSGAPMGVLLQAEVLINDSTTPPMPGVVQFAPVAVSVDEDQGAVTLTATRTGGLDGDAEVSYTLVNGTAVAGQDYAVNAPISGTLQWLDGQAVAQTIMVGIEADMVVEGDETFSAELSNPVGVALGSNSVVTVTIVDTTVVVPVVPGTVQFTATNVSVAEDAGSAQLTVTRTGGSDGAVSVVVDTDAGTASLGSDYVNTSVALSWADGDATSRTVTIPIVFDTTAEQSESFTVNLQGAQPTGVIGTPASATVTINNVFNGNPGTLQFTASSLSVDEDDGMLSVVVSRTGGSDGAVSATYETLAGTGTVGDDFTSASGMLNWGDGDTGTRTIQIAILEDLVDEGAETFSVSLTSAAPFGASQIGTPSEVSVTINNVSPPAPDPTPPPVLTPGTVRFVQPELGIVESAGTVTIAVERVGGVDGDLSVQYTTVDENATSGDDYQSTTGTLFFADGDATPQLVSLTVFEDDQVEDMEAFVVNLSGAQPDASVIGSPSTLRVFITDETVPVMEPAGILSFANASVEVSEQAGTVTVNVQRTEGSAGSVEVNFRTLDDTATAGADYQSQTGVLQWADGDASPRQIVIPILGDDLVEDPERLVLELSGAAPLGDALQLGLATASIVITDATPSAVIGFDQADTSVAEADGDVRVRVTRSGSGIGAISVNFSVVADTAEAGTDFESVSGNLSWDDGDTSDRIILVPLISDTQAESDEQFVIRLTDLSPQSDVVVFGNAEARVTITDSTNTGFLSLVSDVISADETVGEIMLLVQRTGGTAGSASVDFRTEADTATEDEDYTGTSGTLRWDDGDDSDRTIRIPILTDDIVEQEERFSVLLFNALPLGPQQIQTARAVVTLSDVAPSTPVVPGTPGVVDPDTEGDPEGLQSDLASLALVIVSGDGQGGLPGDELDPLVIDVIDTAPTTPPTNLAGLPISWRAVPEGSAELLDGDQTVSDANGRTSNRIRILTRGFLSVIARIDTSAAQPTNTDGSLALTSRIAPPEVAVADGEVAFTVRSGFFAANGIFDNPAQTGRALDEACEVLGVLLESNAQTTEEQNDLFETCQELNARLTGGALNDALSRLTPDELFFIGDSIIDTSDIQVTNVYSRINAIRSGRREVLDLGGVNLSLYDQSIPGSVVDAAQDALYNGVRTGWSGGGASADSTLGSRLGVFANGSVSFGETDGADNQVDSDVRTSGFTVGVDYRLTADSVIGAGLGFIRNDTDFAADGGDADVSGLNFSLFGTWYREDAGYLDMVLDVGRNDYDINRRINLPNTPDQFARGQTDADVISFTAGMGKEFVRGPWQFGPYGRISFTRANVSAFSEEASTPSDGFGSVLNVASHDVRSNKVSFGGQVSRTVNTRRAVFVPQFRFEAEFESEEQKEGIEATFQHDPTNTPFTVNGNERDTSYMNLGIGTSALLPNGKSGFVFYETQLANDYVTQHWLKLGVRLEFR